MKPNNCNGFDEWSQKRNWWGKELQVAVRRRTFMNLLSLNWFLGNTHSCAIKAHWISVSHLGMNIQSPKPQVITHPADILCRRVICKDKETKQHITSGCTFHQVAVSQCWVTAFPRPLSKDDVTRSKAKLRSDSLFLLGILFTFPQSCFGWDALGYLQLRVHMTRQMSSRRANKGSFHMFIWGEGHRPQHTGTHWIASMKTEHDCFICIERRRREGLSSFQVHTEEPHHCGVCTSVRGNLKVADWSRHTTACFKNIIWRFKLFVHTHATWA